MTITPFHSALKKSWLVAAAILSVAIFWSVQHATAATVQSNDQRMVTIYDRGSEHTIITRATTVKAALAQADVNVDPADVVEPKLSQELVAKNYHVNVYRARPVLVVDGANQYHVITAQQSPRQIAKAANLTLYDEDIAQIDRVNNDDVLSDGGAGLKLNITRAIPFTFVQYGKSFTARTQAKTVGDMLSEKGIKLAAEDGTSVPLSTLIVANMTVQVWRNGVQTFTQEEAIPMPVEKVQDQDQPVGYRVVQAAGTDGKKEVTYQINMQNGVEVSRQVIQEVQTLAPVKQVEVVGTKVSLPPGSHEDWMAAAGIAASDYGYVNYIVIHEGGWEPCKVQGGAINCDYSGSMGYGIVQATPGSKMASAGADWRTNPITQLEWATGYAVGRYGSWRGAYDHWLSSHNW